MREMPANPPRSLSSPTVPVLPQPLAQNPPRSANTKCNVAPPSRLYSDAILSSALHQPANHETVSAQRSFPEKPQKIQSVRGKEREGKGRKGKEREGIYPAPPLQRGAAAVRARDREKEIEGTHICLPPKINRCCTGGMPSFSSTRSFMRETCRTHDRRATSAYPVLAAGYSVL